MSGYYWKVQAIDEFDSDSDDDGIADGVEGVDQDGSLEPSKTNPCAIDNDDDRIQDGTEPV